MVGSSSICGALQATRGGGRAVLSMLPPLFAMRSLIWCSRALSLMQILGGIVVVGRVDHRRRASVSIVSGRRKERESRQRFAEARRA